MSANPETILAKILRSSESIKQVLICDKVGLVISKVLRIKPIEGIGALESSIFRAAEDVCEFLSLGKSVIHISVFSDKTVVGIDIGLGYLVIVLEHKMSWVLDSKVINECLNELINLWVSELGLQGYDFSVVNGVSRIMNAIYSGKKAPARVFESKAGDIIQDILTIKNPVFLANCITNELGLPIAYNASTSINISSEEFGGTLLSLDAVAKEKGENLALGSPVLSAVFTNQNRGVFICHAGVLEGVEPLLFQSLFDLKEGFIPILTEIYNMIIAISKEYGDAKIQYFVETINGFVGQIFPTGEKVSIPAAVQDEQRLKLVLAEMGKNIEESITYYMNMIGDLMELISSRALEIRKSIESYDKDFKKWLDDNLGGAHPKIENELKKWEDAKNLIDAKLKQLTEQ